MKHYGHEIIGLLGKILGILGIALIVVLAIIGLKTAGIIAWLFWLIF